MPDETVKAIIEQIRNPPSYTLRSVGVLHVRQTILEQHNALIAKLESALASRDAALLEVAKQIAPFEPTAAARIREIVAGEKEGGG